MTKYWLVIALGAVAIPAVLVSQKSYVESRQSQEELTKSSLKGWLCRTLPESDIGGQLGSLPGLSSVHVEHQKREYESETVEKWLAKSSSVEAEYIKFLSRKSADWRFALWVEPSTPLFMSEHEILAWLQPLGTAPIVRTEADDKSYVQHLAGDAGKPGKPGFRPEHEWKLLVVVTNAGKTKVGILGLPSYAARAKRFCE